MEPLRISFECSITRKLRLNNFLMVVLPTKKIFRHKHARDNTQAFIQDIFLGTLLLFLPRQLQLKDLPAI